MYFRLYHTICSLAYIVCKDGSSDSMGVLALGCLCSQYTWTATHRLAIPSLILLISGMLDQVCHNYNTLI